MASANSVVCRISVDPRSLAAARALPSHWNTTGCEGCVESCCRAACLELSERPEAAHATGDCSRIIHATNNPPLTCRS